MKTTLQILDVVALLETIGESPQGQVGTIVEILDEEKEVFEVEFTNKDGETVLSCAIEGRYLLRLEYQWA